MIRTALPLTGVIALSGLSVVQQRAIQVARQDALTGLATRRYWTTRAGRAIRKPRNLAVVLIDGDGLRRVNNSRGHDAGDAVLVTIAHRLKSWTDRRGMAGRLGGDEFAAFIRIAPDQRLVDELDTLNSTLSAPAEYRRSMLPAGASIGAALVAALPAPTLYQALRAADLAMYQAKRAGGGTWNLAGHIDEPFPIDRAPIQRTRHHGSGATSILK